MIKNKIEVLCPSGDFESVVAAVQNGADAVYLGAKDLSARQNAKNFDDEELINAVKYCHIRGVKVYLAINTIIFDSQLADVVNKIKQACSIGIDALIVQDMGVLSIIRELAPSMPIHASTQMAVHTRKGAQLLLGLGVKRVVLAREMTLDEIADITHNVEIETEVFVHGALCMSVSGQCYMSGMIGGRSGNRGNCAGTCRLPFSINGHNAGDYALSLKDNCAVEQVQKLVDFGVTSIKIEGRMKRPEYVAAAAKAYSSARNSVIPDMSILRAVFSRSGFTNGYLTGEINSEMFGFRKKSDVVAATPEVLKTLANTYKKESGAVPLKMEIKVSANQEIKLMASDCDGNTATAQADKPEKAINIAVTEEKLIASLSKLGSTPFYVDNIKVELEDGLSVPASIINELRRKVCAEIEQKREQKAPIEINEEFCLDAPIKARPSHSEIKLRARFRFFEQIPIELMNSFEYIILPLDEVSKNRMSLSPYKDKIIIEPYRVMFSTENDMIKKLNSLYEEGYRHLSADNIAHIQIANEIGYSIHVGCYLNCTNSANAKMLGELNANDITLSFELELTKANRINTNLGLGLIVYGYLPLMIMRNCPIKATIECKECNSTKSLTDRMAMKFRVICNNRRYSEILNSNRLHMAQRMGELGSMDFVTFYFTVEEKEECADVVQEYIDRAPAIGEFTRGLYYRGV